MDTHIPLSSVSFFCPAYNDEGNLPDLIPTVHGFLTKHAAQFEIVIIEDCSPDNTGAVSDDLAKQFSHTRVVHHKKNRGYSATLKEGFETARLEYVMYTDGDNQYNVYDLEPHLHLLGAYDVLAGHATRKAVARSRKVQSWVHNRLINLQFFSSYHDINCALKIFKKCVIDSICINSDPRGAFIDAELILKARMNGFKIAQFPVVHHERRSGIASGSRPEIILKTAKDMLKLRLGLL